jgi:hypothetical protein
MAAGYLLDVDPDQVDLLRFRRLVDEVGRVDDARELLGEGLGLWPGNRQRWRVQGRGVRAVHRLPARAAALRTRAKSSGQNGVRERAFGSLKDEPL